VVASLAEVIAGLLLLVGVGVVLRLTGLLSADEVQPINTVLLYVGVPALVFRAVHPAKLTPELLIVAAVAWVVALLAFGLAWLAARALRLGPRSTGALMLAAALGNTGYIGYPLTLAFLGHTGLVRAVFYDVFGTVLALLTVGFAVASHYGRAEERVNVLREIVKFPPVIAVFAALVLHPLPIPNLVSSGIDAFANMTVPLIMISVGVSLRPTAVREHGFTIGVVGAIKLLAAPLVALLLGRLLFGGAPAIERLVVLEAGMPSMMLGLIVGRRFDLDHELIAAAIVVTTAASAITVPLLQLLVR